MKADERFIIRQLAGKKSGLTRKLNDLALLGKQGTGSFRSIIKQIRALEKEIKATKSHGLAKTREQWHMPSMHGTSGKVDEAMKSHLKRNTSKSYKGMTEPKELGKYVERLHKRLYDKRGGAKIKSRLIKNRKTAIPGFSYWFKK